MLRIRTLRIKSKLLRLPVCSDKAKLFRHLKLDSFSVLMLPKALGSSLSSWIYPCTVISQGQDASFKPLQPPAFTRQQCENLCERNICAFRLLFSRETSLNQIGPLLVTFSFMFSKEHSTASSASAVPLRGVQCHWVSSAALRLPSEPLNLSKSAALQHRQLCMQRREQDRKGEGEMFAKAEPFLNYLICVYCLQVNLRRG